MLAGMRVVMRGARARRSRTARSPDRVFVPKCRSVDFAGACHAAPTGATHVAERGALENDLPNPRPFSLECGGQGWVRLECQMPGKETE